MYHNKITHRYWITFWPSYQMHIADLENAMFTTVTCDRSYSGTESSRPHIGLFSHSWHEVKLVQGGCQSPTELSLRLLVMFMDMHQGKVWLSSSVTLGWHPLGLQKMLCLLPFCSGCSVVCLLRLCTEEYCKRYSPIYLSASIFFYWTHQTCTDWE